MEKNRMISAIMLVALGMSAIGCGKKTVIGLDDPVVVSDAKFDKREMVVEIDSDTKIVKVAFHRQALPMSDKYIVLPPIGFMLVESTAEHNTHFTVDGVGSDGLSFQQPYNLTDSTGVITINLMPAAIDRPMEIHMITYYGHLEHALKDSVTVRLMPVK